MKRAKSSSSAETDDTHLHSEAKRSKISGGDQNYDFGLMDLSDDVLLNIFKHLSSYDLMALHLCCVRLSELCRDRTLWKNLDLRDRYLSLQELEEYVKFMQPVTKFLAIRGNRRKDEFPELHPGFLKTICSECQQLEHFILEDYKISREKIQITSFPKTLRKLSLKGCQVSKDPLIPMGKSYLCKIDTHMPNLTCLILSNCDWLDCHSFMAISKMPKLKEMRVNSCYGLDEDIAYVSLACRYGLKSLEVLDLRDTFIGDSVVSSFSYTANLTEMYLECPSSETVHHQPNEIDPLQEVVIIQLQRRPEIVIEGHQLAAELLNENEVGQLTDGLASSRKQISDRSICTLGQRGNHNNQEIIQNHNEVQVIQRRPRTSTNPNLRKLVVRNYTGVTNLTLYHFALNGPNLEYLDVTGTSVTRAGLQTFKVQRPEVDLVSSFDDL